MHGSLGWSRHGIINFYLGMRKTVLFSVLLYHHDVMISQSQSRDTSNTCKAFYEPTYLILKHLSTGWTDRYEYEHEYLYEWMDG